MELERGDAFGETLLACLEAGDPPPAWAAREIIERDDGRLDAQDAARYFVPPQGRLAEWVLARAGGRVLDIGAGAGRFALILQSLGLEVTALDVSPGAVEVCRRRGIRSMFTGTVADLARAGVDRPYDTFLLMGNNLGLLGGPWEASGFLGALAALGAPDALILAEGLDALQTDRPEHLAYHARNRAAGRLAGQIRLRVRRGRLATDWMDYLMPSLDELARILDGTAWRLADTVAEGASYVVELRRTS